MSGAIRFCFDFLSPYAYLAWTRIHAIAGAAGREVEPVPVLFAGLLGAHGTRGPAEVPAKRRYVMRDILRIADALGTPMAPPAALPFKSLRALRIASLPLEPAVRRRLIDRIFAGAWARSEDVTDRAVLERIAAEVGLDPAIVAHAEAPENKDRLRAQTDAVLAEGVFGVPTALVDGELFWGTDSLPHLERFLAGHQAVDGALLDAFDRVPVGATRRS